MPISPTAFVLNVVKSFIPAYSQAEAMGPVSL